MGQAHSLLAKSSVSGVWGVELARRHSDDTAGISSVACLFFSPDAGIAFPSVLRQELKQESLPLSTLLSAVGVRGPPRGFVLIFEAFESGSSLRGVWTSVN